MIDLLYFTNRACADAIWAAKRNQNSGIGFIRLTSTDLAGVVTVYQISGSHLRSQLISIHHRPTPDRRPHVWI